MASPYTNIHGRRATRGVRPWLLIPKVLAVAVYFGGLAAALVLWVARGFIVVMPDAPPVPDRQTIMAVQLLFFRVCLPALGAATFFGVLLFFQHPRVFVRQRWWQVKMACLALGVPIGELMVVRGLAGLYRGYDVHVHGFHGARLLPAGLACLLAVAAVLIVLGRQKPRLGQNWARAAPLAVKSPPPNSTNGAHPA